MKKPAELLHETLTRRAELVIVDLLDAAIADTAARIPKAVRQFNAEHEALLTDTSAAESRAIIASTLDLLFALRQQVYHSTDAAIWQDAEDDAEQDLYAMPSVYQVAITA